MTRLIPVARETADAKTTQLLDGVAKSMGMVPNLIATMAHSNAVAKAYLGFSSALAGGSLPARIREQIALTVGQQNNCDYCLAAHSVLGAKAGLDDHAILDARRGNAIDQKEDSILKFASTMVENRGHVSDEDVAHLRNQGVTDTEIAEIVGNVALNIFTNYFNHVSGTEVDFPAAAELPAEQPACSACG